MRTVTHEERGVWYESMIAMRSEVLDGEEMAQDGRSRSRLIDILGMGMTGGWPRTTFWDKQRRIDKEYAMWSVGGLHLHR